MGKKHKRAFLSGVIFLSDFEFRPTRSKAFYFESCFSSRLFRKFSPQKETLMIQKGQNCWKQKVVLVHYTHFLLLKRKIKRFSFWIEDWCQIMLARIFIYAILSHWNIIIKADVPWPRKSRVMKTYHFSSFMLQCTSSRDDYHPGERPILHIFQLGIGKGPEEYVNRFAEKRAKICHTLFLPLTG